MLGVEVSAGVDANGIQYVDVEVCGSGSWWKFQA
jgi:hypothetical protein